MNLLKILCSCAENLALRQEMNLMFDFGKCILYLFHSADESHWLCKNCIKIQELENRRDLYTPALGPFNYHIKGKCKCLYQFLINLTLSISNWKIFEVLKQRLLLTSNSSASEKTATIFTRLSDSHKLVLTVLKKLVLKINQKSSFTEIIKNSIFLTLMLT